MASVNALLCQEPVNSLQPPPITNTKRPHHKTRSGCVSCKKRRVKCDELRPRCTSCGIRNIKCEYPSTRHKAGSQSGRADSHSPVAYSANSREGSIEGVAVIPFEQIPQKPTYYLSSTHTKMNDLRLLHHYCTVTIESLGFSIENKAVSVWKKAVPELAFKHEFLMDNLLAVASLHIDLLNPHSADNGTTAVYRDKAFQAYRKALANLTGENISAVLVVAILMSLSALVANRDVDDGKLCSLNWLEIYIGVGVILQDREWEDVVDPSVAPIFSSQKFIPVSIHIIIPSILQKMLDLINDDDEDAPFRAILAEAAVSLGKVYGRIVVDFSDPAAAFAVMSWPYMVPKAFIDLARQNRPRALVILAHYFIFFDVLPQCWWTVGVARRHVDAISKVLSSKWQPFLVMPAMSVSIGGKDRVLEYLISQFRPPGLTN